MTVVERRLWTIGFTKKSAEHFFNSLRDAGVKRLIDVRLNNISQLAGFAKRDDLRFFLKDLAGIEYSHLLDLAPLEGMLDAYKKKRISWAAYELQFLQLMRDRRIEEVLPRELFDASCLLCSEDTPHHCHRRLVAEYLQGHWKDFSVRHLR
ncbi:DUF488 family protein [Planctomyces sp. SH-PL14]|uniref:DUF488 domain-containing protein n=1 Tax=Planctomyces sp. SH-PL14 TaxID=1632864 RepID=UPI00078BAA34|nr:DUF488 domain-containing protein [Planctomyces sp. SH-PL14]AMV19048.1 hypothetical protein VT03_14250 [Planctomyces sp. SH-PL14]